MGIDIITSPGSDDPMAKRDQETSVDNLHQGELIPNDSWLALAEELWEIKMKAEGNEDENGESEEWELQLDNSGFWDKLKVILGKVNSDKLDTLMDSESTAKSKGEKAVWQAYLEDEVVQLLRKAENEEDLIKIKTAIESRLPKQS